jgi:hypothetical protein
MMQSVCLMATLAGASALLEQVTALPFPPALHDAVMREVNGAGGSWVAGRSPRFEGLSLAQAARLMGSPQSPRPADFQLKSPEQRRQQRDSLGLPKDFDSRTNWSLSRSHSRR